MKVRNFSLFLAGSFMCVCFSGGSVAQEDLTEKEVRKVAEQACQALKNRDVDALLKLADAPWWHWLSMDRNRIFKKQEDLHAWIKTYFTDPKHAPHDGLEALTVEKILPYKKSPKKFNPKDHEFLDQVLAPNDWVVWINAKVSGNDGPDGQLLVAKRNGQWKIVGLDTRD